MAKDIEEFLRRAAERRRQQQGKSAQPPQPTARQPQRPAPQQPPRSRTSPGRSVPQEPMIIEDVEVVSPPPRRKPKPRPQKQRVARQDMRRQSVAEHVESHLDTSKIARHAEDLGSNIAGAHDRIESRIQSRLDNDLSRIDDRPTVTDDAPAEIFGAASSELADQLRGMLRDPKSIGNAILLAEILKRPDFDASDE